MDQRVELQCHPTCRLDLWGTCYTAYVKNCQICFSSSAQHLIGQYSGQTATFWTCQSKCLYFKSQMCWRIREQLGSHWGHKIVYSLLCPYKAFIRLLYLICCVCSLFISKWQTTITVINIFRKVGTALV